MGTGTFNDLGFRGGNDNEIDLVAVFEGLRGWTVTDVTPYVVDYGDDDVLTVGEETTISFSIVYEDPVLGSFTADVVLTGTYLGYDDTGSPHINPEEISATDPATSLPLTVPPEIVALIDFTEDMRVTNDPDYPQKGIGDYPDYIEGSLELCFAAGTMIATPDGERAVETLRAGDMILAADGRSIAVKWIGHQTLYKRFSGQKARPVRVMAGALGNGLPHADLVLTADHALILDGLAINAGALVNGVSIVLEPLETVAEEAVYYHVETEEHDVILANGAEAETFVDYVGRSHFDNYAEYLELFGQPDLVTEMRLPRVSSARLVPQAIRDRLLPAQAA